MADDAATERVLVPMRRDDAEMCLGLIQRAAPVPNAELARVVAALGDCLQSRTRWPEGCCDMDGCVKAGLCLSRGCQHARKDTAGLRAEMTRANGDAQQYTALTDGELRALAVFASELRIMLVGQLGALRRAARRVPAETTIGVISALIAETLEDTQRSLLSVAAERQARHV